LLRELRDAAARGVRVRLLLDDLHSVEAEELLLGLAAHANVEVRVFNPLLLRIGSPLTRLALSPGAFEQLHRRMHTKLVIADGHVAISGGRNMADEYFMHARPANFVDLDLLTTGPVVPRLSEVFEAYWNSELARSLVDASGRTAAVTRARFDASVRGERPLVAPARWDLLGRSPVSAQLDEGWLELQFADMRVLADPPHKVLEAPTLEASALGLGLQALRQAQSEVLIVSPYFIPGGRGLAMMREAADAGIRIMLLTNSLAATDEPMVHHAYANYRDEMLGLGVIIHELSPVLSRKAGVLGDFKSSDGRLHAKVALADRRWVLLGSMNMDGRSALANTELGLLLDSPALAHELRHLLLRAHATSSYRVRRAPRGIEWVTHDGAAEQVRHDEPGTDWALRLKLGLLSLFIAEDLL
jgi:putative cardiolipin synthase